MQLKDVITLVFSGLAFVLSAVATTITLIRGKYEQQRTTRNQLGETLSRIAETNLENAKLLHETAQKDPLYFQQLSGILGQQQASLLNQAMYLTDQIPKLVTAFDYNTIAVANANAGDAVLAEKYHRKAIEASSNNYFKALATRGYAVFLFTQRRFEDGRTQFRQAISLVTGGDNLARYTNGLTYQTWAWNELNNAGAQVAAEQLLESARHEFKGIDNDAVRENAIRTLEATLAPITKPAPAQAAPSAAAAFAGRGQA